jgi:hypothetical protein
MSCGLCGGKYLPEKKTCECGALAHESDAMAFKIKAANDLIDYLEAHEDDIACGINDFGNLKILFEDILQRPPKFT